MTTDRLSTRLGLAVACSALFFSGCATYTQKSAGMDNSLRQMDVPGANQAALAAFQTAEGKRDQLVTLLELSSTTRMAGMYLDENGKPALATLMASPPDAFGAFAMLPVDHPYCVMSPSPEAFYTVSIRTLEDANRTFAFWDNQPEISISEQTSALLTNQTFTEYRGMAADRIMAQTYLALNYLQMGDYDNARVAFNRMHNEQEMALKRNAKELEDAKMMAQNAMNGAQDPESGQTQTYDASKAQQDPKVAAALSSQFAGLKALAPYGDFANPFGLYLESIFLLHCGESFQDTETALKNLQYVYGMSSSQQTLDALSLAKLAAETGQRPQNITYVIIESGAAPVLEEVRIDIPLFVLVEDTNLPYVGAAFPKLTTRDDRVRAFNIDADGTLVVPQVVCSMDRIIGEEFQRRLPTIITKAIISAGLKGTITYYAKKKLDTGNYWANLAANAALSIGNAALNSADTRSWHTLPKEIHVAQFTTPASRTIRITTPSGEHQPLEMQLLDGPVNVVVVRSSGALTPLLASQFVLNPSLIGHTPTVASIQ